MTDPRMAGYAALVLRVALSGMFIAHLYRKFMGVGFAAWWHGLNQAGYADWMLGYTVAAEFAGAVLLLLGIYTRYVSVFVLPVLIAVAYHWAIRKGFWFSDGGAEFPLAWTAMLVAQAFLGNGAYAVKTPPLPWERGVPRAPARDAASS